MGTRFLSFTNTVFLQQLKHVSHLTMATFTPMPPPVCTNCQKVQCLNGQEVHLNQARVGLVVTNNKGVYGSSSYGPARVLQVHGDGRVTLEGIKQGDNGWRFSGGTHSHYLFGVCGLRFLYNCK